MRRNSARLMGESAIIRTVTGRRPEVARQAIVAGLAVVLGLVVAVGPAAADVPPPGGAAAQSMTLTSSTPVLTLGTSVLTVQFRDGFTPFGNSFDIWACPDTTIAPVDSVVNTAEEKGDCIVITFWGRGEDVTNVAADATSRAVKENLLTMSWLIDVEERDAYFVYDTDAYLESVPGLEENFEDPCVAEGLYVIVHDYREDGGRNGKHSNFIGPLRIPGCASDEEEVTAAHPMELACTPDPVVPGGTVTCVITQGDPGIDILWRASYNPVFAEQGVTLDEDGRGTFTFVAPRTAQGQAISVELVEWLPAATVQVSGVPLPTRLPAGEGSGALPLGLALGALVLTGAAALRLRRAGAVS